MSGDTPPGAPADATIPHPVSAPAHSTRRLARFAGVIGAATMTSRILGLVRDQALAFHFGAGDAMDAFNVAFRVPNLLRDLFAEGAMSAAFIPSFTRALVGSRENAWRLASLVITTLLVATGVVVLLGLIFAEPLVDLMAGDYRATPGKFELTVHLARLLLPFLAFVAVAAVLMGMLNALGYFFVPAASPAMFNVASIACVMGLAPIAPAFGQPAIMAAAAGALLGGLLQGAIQWPPLRREGFRFRPRFDFSDPQLRAVLVLMGPGTLGLAAVQINLVVNTILAAGEGAGAVSWLAYAFRIMYLPIGLFGVSIATAAAPSIARHAAADAADQVRRTVSSGLRMMLMLNVPAALGLAALATPICSLLFERGQFTSADTQATSAALIAYAPGLLGYSAVKIIAPTFYALQDSRTPVAISVVTVAVNIALNIALVRVLGYQGLALGVALTSLLNGGLLVWRLSRRLGGLDGRRIAVAFVKILAASLIMAAAAGAVERSLHLAVPGAGTAVQALRVGTATAAGLATLALAARALRIAEFDGAVQAILGRLRRR
jgi:putative peptidoglycan lipid II flippase